MFEEFQQLDDLGLLAAMAESLRVERAAAARRMVALGVLTQRRVVNADPESQYWCVEDWEALAGEVGAELGISRGRASGEMSYGETLVTRLPRLAERFLAGDLDVRVFTTIDFRTALVTDPDILGHLDELLARQAPGWSQLSREKLTHVIDWLVVELDPNAQRITRDHNDDRRIEIAPDAHQPGMASVWGRLPAADGAALDKRLDTLAAAVCPGDPRTNSRRRADALIALSEGAATLACECGTADCPFTAKAAEQTLSQIVLHVIAEQATLAEEGSTQGYVPGYGLIPADTVREMANKPGVKVKPLIVPKDPAPEPGYRPSAALAEFVRQRDLACRWPGCDVPADRCDLDHTVPYPHGPTHPSNLKLYCRTHHLIKTFFSGPRGWTERQDPDSTMTFRSPSGRTYVTKPAGSLFFPQLATSTGDLVLPTDPPADSAHKTLMMPTRRRTRAAEREARISWERGLREAEILANPPPF